MKQLIKQSDLQTKTLLALLVLGIWVLIACFYFVPRTINAQQAQKQTNFDQITVHRINIVEPDGTLRMILSDKTAFPGLIVKGKEIPHNDRTSAGMLFFDDEGTENGGLLFGGMKDKADHISSYGHLSFDRYQQDQVFTIQTSEEDGKKQSGLHIDDRPDYPLADIMSLSATEFEKFNATHAKPHGRIYLARADYTSVALRLKDTEGRNRIVIQVGADGSPMIQFLDKDGKVTSLLK